MNSTEIPDVIIKPAASNPKMVQSGGLLRALGQLFELEGRDRLLPMEGLRGVAVILVFLQHYCMQFLLAGNLSGPTEAFAAAFRNYGNRGVELFFVLSGFLIYGILLRKKPNFLQFMLRRAQRLYPAFLAALVIACAVDFTRPSPFIPRALFPAAKYLLENLLFLPGLFPITPLSAVNWSLSYEWWFYAFCTALFATLGLGRSPARFRVATIAAIAVLMVVLSAFGIPNTPVRGLSLLAGMLLAEAERARLRPVNSGVAILAIAISFAVGVSAAAPEWLNSIILASSFYALCSAAFFRTGWLASLLSANLIRRLGNMSYSFYLVHGFAVVTVLHFLLRAVPAGEQKLAFWVAILPVLFIAVCCGASLFLAVEKPFSFRVKVSGKVSATSATIFQ